MLYIQDKVVFNRIHIITSTPTLEKLEWSQWENRGVETSGQLGFEQNCGRISLLTSCLLRKRQLLL